MAPRSRFHLLGGGPGTMLSLRRHVRSALADVPAGRKRPMVAYVGAASDDNAAFRAMVTPAVVLAGARLVPVTLCSKRAKLSAAKTVLEDCDAVFMMGGDVDAGMNVLHERDVVPLFRALAHAGRPMIGVSAGSIMLGRAWVRFADEATSREPGIFPCLDLAPVYVDAHAEEDDWAELKILLRLLALGPAQAAVGYGLTRKGGVTVERDAGTTRVIALGTPTPRFAVRGGHVEAIHPLALGSSEEVRDSPSPPRRRPSSG